MSSDYFTPYFLVLCFADDHSARLYVGNLSVDTNEGNYLFNI